MANLKISRLFQSPGQSLLMNPFGSTQCCFLGVFYPINPTIRLVEIQELAIRLMMGNGQALFFIDNDVDDFVLIEGDLSENLLREIDSSDQLYDLNVFFPSTSSGLVLSQEESLLFCASLNDNISTNIEKIKINNIAEIDKSVREITNHVKILSGFLERYFI